MLTRISAIIPTYNRPELVVQAIASVHQQTLAGIEIIVVDDGSDAPVEEKIRKTENLRFWRQPNRGLNAARNAALNIAQGEFIALLDDDDLWLPFKTEIQLGVLERFPDVSFVFSDYGIFNQKGTKTDSGLTDLYNFPLAVMPEWQCNVTAREAGLPLFGGKDYHVFIGSIYHALLHGPYVLPSTTLVRRSAIRRRKPFPEENIHCGDWRFFAELTRNAPCAFLALSTAMNRSHSDAVRLTRKSPLVRMRDRIDLISAVWRSDHAFVSAHGDDVDKVEAELLCKISLLCLLEGRRDEAIASLKRWHGLPSRLFGPKGVMLYFAAYLPLVSYFLRFLRRVKAWAKV